jgi:3,4-dihydroxy 2-butanone 4-phosphate synthase/GTP cyclohydrolase II
VEHDLLRATEARLSGTAPAERPLITLGYAQSLDGSIAAADGRPLALSSEPSLFRTHALRARHDALLVGVGTVLSDDPQLTVRHAAGPNPQAIVLDTDLRTPLPARLLAHPRRPWFVAGAPVVPARRAALVNAGAVVLEAPRSADDLVDLPGALKLLAGRGLRSIMVEGGARVLRSFLTLRLVDWVIITIAPVFAGGKPALSAVEGRASSSAGDLPGIVLRGMERSGPDLFVWGELR